MKKLIAAVMAVALGSAVFAGGTNDVDAYAFKASLKVPYLTSGTRSYKSQSLKGYLYLAYDADTRLIDAWIEAVNTKTKVKHVINVKDGFYNLLGKSSKKEIRTVPTIFFVGADSNAKDQTGHECIVECSIAGNGALKSTKVQSGGCGACGDVTEDVYCSMIKSMSGNINGVMDCLCPPGGDWNHTLMAGRCGALTEENKNPRSNKASFWGSWSAKYDAKASYSVSNN